MTGLSAPQAPPAGRSARVERAAHLRAAGRTCREIAAEMGVATQTASAYATDPDGSRARARKESYAGRCLDCGVTLNGSAGRGPRTPKRCVPCNSRLAGEKSRRRILGSLREWADEHDGAPPSITDWKKASRRRWPAPSTVAAAFGTWNAGVRAAGLDCHPGGSGGPGTLSDGEKCRTRRLYRSGLSLVEVADLCGVSSAAISQRLERMGEPRRPAVRRCIS